MWLGLLLRLLRTVLLGWLWVWVWLRLFRLLQFVFLWLRLGMWLQQLGLLLDLLFEPLLLL